jgi:multidrug efflux pump subunit AcrA (membrane-fusion protein)
LLLLPAASLLGLSLASAAPGPLDGIAPANTSAPSDQSWRDVRVQVVAHNAASLGSPQGQVLARFVCGEQEGSLAHARALLTEKREVLATNTKLHNLGTGSGLDFHVAAAQVEEAAADLQTAAAVVENCAVKAPFPGRVASVAARPYQFVGVGQPLLDILDDRTLDLELIVPSRWLSWLRTGTPFTVTVDETGRTYDAVVDRLSGKVDAVSQSIKAYGRLAAAAPELLAGMSGRAAIEPPSRAAAIDAKPGSAAR